MNFFEPIILGIVLSADSFSASIAMGVKPHKSSDVLKFAALSGGAELIATFAGALAGEKVISQFGQYDHWIAFFLLFAVSIHMLYEGFTEWKQRHHVSQDVTFHGFIKLICVSIATSMDALAVGVSLGISDKPLWPYLVSIGAWAFILTIVGMGIAKRLPKRLAPVFNIVGATIILIIALEMLDL